MSQVLADMRYQGYQWQINPLTLQVTQALGLSVSDSESEERVVSSNRSVAVYKGEGEFAGEDALQRYRLLEECFMKHKQGVLTLPGFMPFEAYFSKLTLSADTTPQMVKYTFEFRRDLSVSTYFGSKTLHRVKEGESLYDVAYTEDVALNKLVELNPHIRDIRVLEAGEQVRLC